MVATPADGLTTTDYLESTMAKRHYTADSAFLLPSSPLLCARSCVTGGCAVVPDVGRMADGISLSVSATTIS